MTNGFKRGNSINYSDWCTMFHDENFVGWPDISTTAQILYGDSIELAVR
jgi:hypothetical protein